MQLRGCGTAIVTPFRADGSIDETALRNLVTWQIESGIDFLVPCGTTGETPTLTHDEWLRVIDITIEVTAGRVPIVAGATSNSTNDAVAKAKEVAARSGVNAILTASPYYNKPTQEGQYRHFRAIAEAVDKPVILYNVPGRTGANIEPATIGRLLEVANIAGVKEASGNIAQIAEVCALVPETFSVLSGDDAATLPVIAFGGVGLISVASNEIPREMAELTRAALNNDWHTARALNRKYIALMQANFIESNPLPVKAVLAMMGKIEEVYRLPLLPMRRDTRSKLQKNRHRRGPNRESGSRHSRQRRFLRLRKLGSWSAQNRSAPLRLRTMQSWQRPPRRPRPQPCQMARPLRDLIGSPPVITNNSRRPNPQRMQMHLAFM
jgi:4-hydroxy-tetrahydrodipicolinate synthase